MTKFAAPMVRIGYQVSLQSVPGVLKGDVNLDGAIDLLDVSPFVDRISSGNYQAEADCNCDGVTDLLDIAPFIDILTGG